MTQGSDGVTVPDGIYVPRDKVCKVKISPVLDVSGLMSWTGAGTNDTKIKLVRDAVVRT